MTAGYRSSASAGGSQFTASASIPVPAGADAGDIVLAFLTRWSGGGFPAIVPPAGFTQVTLVSIGANEFSAWWKRLSAADTGSYTFSWDGSAMWNHADAVAVTGAPETGNPLEDFGTANNSGGTYPAVTVTASDAGTLLVWHGSSQSVGTHTPPSGFTEVVDADTDATAYRSAGASGDHLASGATSTASNPNIAFLAAVVPAPSGQVLTVDITDGLAASDASAKSVTLALADGIGGTDRVAREYALVLHDGAGLTDDPNASSGSSTVRRAHLTAQTRLAAAVASLGRLHAALEEQP